MLTSLFKKPQNATEPNDSLRHAEQALQDRVNRMLRQNLRVDWTPPPMRPEMTRQRAIHEALAPRK